LFQLLPGGVLHGATGLMFAMITLAGLRILRSQANQQRTMTMLVACTLGAMAITQSARLLGLVGIEMPGYLALLTSFPVASGALMAMTWEVVDKWGQRNKWGQSKGSE
jgi:xanthine/uracil permease